MITRDHLTTVQQMGETQLPLWEDGSRTVDATNINNLSSALQSTSSLATPEYSSFYHQQIMINAQLFLQQQQTVNVLIRKVDGLIRLVENRKEQTASVDENTRIKQISKKEVINKKNLTLYLALIYETFRPRQRMGSWRQKVTINRTVKTPLLCCREIKKKTGQ